MRLHFYKLQIGGNNFILIDDTKNILPSEYDKISITLCSRRYGIGASGCMFLTNDNSLQIFNHRGQKESDATDALLCAARFAFDSGRINRDSSRNNTINFFTNYGEKKLNIISSREFEINLGTPFSFISGKILTHENNDCLKTFYIENRPICISAIHLIQNTLVALNSNIENFSFFEFYLKLQKNFNSKKIFLTFARNITKETITLRTLHHGLSTICTSAASAVISSWYNGGSNKDAICVFEHGNPNLWTQQNKLQEDTDASRRIAVLWDTQNNNLKVIGTGGYLFEGYFDYVQKTC